MEGLIESAAGVMAINDIAGYNRYIGTGLKPYILGR